MTQDSPPPVAGPEPERGVGRRFGWPAAAAIGLLCAVVGVLAVVVVASMNKGEGVQAQVIESHGHNTAAVAPASAPLRSGERFATLGLPDGGTYEPKAPNGGTDDYRCFLLDPQLANDATLSGVQVLPGNRELVHHAILYRVSPAELSAAKTLDAGSAGSGWTCFGGTLIPSPAGVGAIDALDDAPWLAAWAPGGKESVYDVNSGVKLEKGTQIVLQMHYNLRESQGVDNSQVQLRLTDQTKGIEGVHTMLLPAPVELPCAAGETGRLCDRNAAIYDVTQRFGEDSRSTIAGLQILCDGSPLRPKSGDTQSCTRTMKQNTRIAAAAGHMHLLGKSISIDVNPGTARARTVLNIDQWDFDNQGARRLPKAVDLKAGDTVRVRCTHNAGLRSQLPALKGTEPRYVVWGEGTTDEMCLGVLVVTHPR